MTNTIAMTRQATATVALTLSSWIAAALLVTAAHDVLDAVSPTASTAVKMLAILGMAFLYMRMTRGQLTVEEALFAGMLWAALAMVTEVAASAHGGRPWFALLGSPDRKILRDLLLLAWIGAPALFARRE